MGSLKNKTVLVTGSTGFVGRNLVPLLKETGCSLLTPGRKEYDLLEQAQVRAMFRDLRPEVVFHLAGLIGGIGATKERPAEFCYGNLVMGTLMIHEAYSAGAEKYITLIGGCSYPAAAESPIRESELFRGYPQPESASYALAKGMSHVQAEAYRRQYGLNAVVLVPGNLYGPFDNFDLRYSHVIPALIRKFDTAKETGVGKVTVWGSGNPVRDFVFIADACNAIRIAAETYDSPDLINLSSGVPTSIRELVETIAELTRFRGEIVWDASKPDGQAVKIFDNRRMKELLGFRCETSLRSGLEKTIRWYRENRASVRTGEE